jgi:hypothetical protein
MVLHEFNKVFDEAVVALLPDLDCPLRLACDLVPLRKSFDFLRL